MTNTATPADAADLIFDLADELAQLHRTQGWVGGGADYDIGTYHGDREVLASRLHRVPSRDEIVELEQEIRHALNGSAS